MRSLDLARLTRAFAPVAALVASGSSSCSSQSSEAYGACTWPASLNGSGPGACTVGRAYLACHYSSGVVCEGGVGASSAGAVTQECISNDPGICDGCESTSGPPTCTNQCRPDEYALSCGGPPMVSADGASALTISSRRRLAEASEGHRRAMVTRAVPAADNLQFGGCP